MKHNEKLKEKIEEISNDEIFIGKIQLIDRLLADLSIEYAAFGSCSIQSYFPVFFKTPNDLDIVIWKTEMDRLRSFCEAKNYEVITKYGRLKIFIEKFHLNVISQRLDVITDISKSICGTINLYGFDSKITKRDLNLINSKNVIKIKVLPLEHNLFLELFRAVYTDSLFTVFFIFKSPLWEESKFLELLYTNESFIDLVVSRLLEYSEKIARMEYFQRQDLNKVVDRILNLIELINKQGISQAL
ncbi:MAG: hypothetical protein EOO43_11335 [Flavobacterium sp.]|nr:MAG: hypothetical protein EOO43_11335 [Flavobacterium sp.]